MKKYIKAEVVNAVPMTKQEAFKIISGASAYFTNEKENEGYLVEDEHYKVKWIPKEEFKKRFTEYDEHELSSTVSLMNSLDYMERFVAEHKQLVIRYTKLKDMVHKWDRDELDFNPICPRELYDTQLKAMCDYLSVLQKRAAIENIYLPAKIYNLSDTAKKDTLEKSDIKPGLYMDIETHENIIFKPIDMNTYAGYNLLLGNQTVTITEEELKNNYKYIGNHASDISKTSITDDIKNDECKCSCKCKDKFAVNQNRSTVQHQDILDEIHNLYISKNKDYGNSFSKLFKEFELVGTDYMLTTKMNRFKQLSKGEVPNNESIRDTLMDLANYAILTIMELDNKDNK